MCLRSDSSLLLLLFLLFWIVLLRARACTGIKTDGFHLRARWFYGANGRLKKLEKQGNAGGLHCLMARNFINHLVDDVLFEQFRISLNTNPPNFLEVLSYYDGVFDNFDMNTPARRICWTTLCTKNNSRTNHAWNDVVLLGVLYRKKTIHAGEHWIIRS